MNISINTLNNLLEEQNDFKKKFNLQNKININDKLSHQKNIKEQYDDKFSNLECTEMYLKK